MSFAQDATSNVGRGFISAAEKFDKERGLSDDINAFFACNGYGVRHWQNPLAIFSYHYLLV